MDKEILQQLVEKNFSTAGISKELGISQTNVRYWLKKYDLKTNFIQYNKLPKIKHRIPGEINPCRVCGNDSAKGNLCNSCRTSIRRVQTKLAAIQYLGSMCIDCGWMGNDEESNAYEFHHLSSEEKEYEIGRCLNKSWDFVKKELDKCVLLCSRCHRIRHSREKTEIFMEAVRSYNGYKLNFSDVPVSDANPSVQKQLEGDKRVCNNCGEMYVPRNVEQMYCSPKCVLVYARKFINDDEKIRPLAEDLVSLISSKSYVEIGKIYGVSDNTVKRWAIDYNITLEKRTGYLKNIVCPVCNVEFKPSDKDQKLCSVECSKKYRGYHEPPSKEELLEKLQEFRMTDLEKYYGVHRKTIWDWRKKYMI